MNIPLMIVDWTGYHLHGKHVEVAERGIVSQDLPDVGPLAAVRLPSFKGDPAHNGPWVIPAAYLRPCAPPSAESAPS